MRSHMRRRANNSSRVIADLTVLVRRQGCVYEDQYRDALYDQDGTTVSAVNSWVMGNMIPLKRNPPRGTVKPIKKDVSPEYKKKVLRQVKNPNVKTMGTRYLAKLGYSADEGGYYARVVEAKSGASVAESAEVYAKRADAIRVAGHLLRGLRRAAQNQVQTTPSHQQYMKDLDDLVGRIQSATGEADGQMSESPDLTQAKDEVQRAIEKFKKALAKHAAGPTDRSSFNTQKKDLLKEVNDYHPKNVQKWLERIQQAETPADLQQLEMAFYEMKSGVPFDDQPTTHDFTEYVGLPKGEEGEELELDTTKRVYPQGT